MTKHPKTSAEFDYCLDVSGLLCPRPLLETKKALNGLCSGEVLKITATDPASIIDFKAFAAVSPHELLDYVTRATGEYDFWIKKG